MADQQTQAVAQFETNRPLMFSIAYRMLGSVTEAEDIVQEAYLRYQSTNTTEIVSHRAFLSTVVTRLCLNHLQSRRVQQESYVGHWLPEPLLMAADESEQIIPTRQAELHESLSLAFLTLLEHLTPLERAVFLLREVFDYEYSEIAAALEKEEAACRQMFSRAKKHIAENRPRFKPTPEAHRQLLDQFVEAVGSGELDGLMKFLAEDVTLWADGGGKVRGALLHPLHGREVVAKFVLASQRLTTSGVMFATERAQVNGEPALLLRTEGKVFLVLSITVEQGMITAIRVIGNPDKLKGVSKSENEVKQ
ncbi:MAG: RNA polymerase sigma-70 factor [Anaerolineae bacterium]|nr:RNA polymerase sigma-70 factor [Anaerolineae bacterium]